MSTAVNMASAKPNESNEVIMSFGLNLHARVNFCDLYAALQPH